MNKIVRGAIFGGIMLILQALSLFGIVANPTIKYLIDILSFIYGAYCYYDDNYQRIMNQNETVD